MLDVRVADCRPLFDILDDGDQASLNTNLGFRVQLFCFLLVPSMPSYSERR